MKNKTIIYPECVRDNEIENQHLVPVYGRPDTYAYVGREICVYVKDDFGNIFYIPQDLDEVIKAGITELLVVAANREFSAKKMPGDYVSIPNLYAFYNVDLYGFFTHEPRLSDFDMVNLANPGPRIYEQELEKIAVYDNYRSVKENFKEWDDNCEIKVFDEVAIVLKWGNKK